MRMIRIFVAALLLSLLLPTPAPAAQLLTGVVRTAANQPVAAAVVHLAGDNLELQRRTDATGHFAFGGLAIGTYRLSVTAAAGMALATVDLSSGGANIHLTLLPTLARVRVGGTPPLQGSGTDVAFDRATLARMPAGSGIAALLLQTPGAARGANGVVHVNGDHGDIQYIVDGTIVPQDLNRTIGSEIDLADASYVDIAEGAYPAEYGDRFGSVVSITTRGKSGPPGATASVTEGSLGYASSSFAVHTPLAGGTLVSSLYAERSGRALDPPDPVAVHDAGSAANTFLRYTHVQRDGYWNFTLTHALQTFQIPNDVSAGQPAATDDVETQNDLFGTLESTHMLRQGGSLRYGIGFKRSGIVDLPDQTLDLAYSPFSLLANRLARDVTFNLDDDVRSLHHDLRFGIDLDAATVHKRYAVTLAPNAPAGLPNTVIDNAPNVGHTTALYLQDGWQITPRYRLDLGLRSDSFTIFSTQFARGFAQISPRVKLTRSLGSRSDVYLYYGRFFTPFSLENVSPSAAYALSATVQASPAPFDLRPQRDSDYEIGGHLPLARGILGLRVMQKNATDLIDDTQVGLTALHQDINYAQGRIATQSAYYQQPAWNGGRIYASLAHTRSVNRGCETQLLAPCFGAPSDWTPADHDQTWDASGGIVVNNARGGWFSASTEYGSGLSSSGLCAPSVLFCKVPPHLTFDAEEGIALRQHIVLEIALRNLLNDRYRITYLNAQGNHDAAPRTLRLTLRLR